MPTKCDRCQKDTICTQMSFFNTDMCCVQCIDAEKKHPQYVEARTAEEAALRSGNYNFRGIGYPSDR